MSARGRTALSRARLGQTVQPSSPAFLVRFDWVRGLELGAGHAVVHGVTCALGAVALGPQGLLYLALDLVAGRGEVVQDPDRDTWEREQWAGREPVFLGLVHEGELRLHPLVVVEDQAPARRDREGVAAVRRVRDVLAKPV